MADIRVRKLEDWVVQAFRARARRHGRSLEGELRELLREEAQRPRREFTADAEKRLQQLRDRYGTFSNSADLIRQDRDGRG